MVRRILRVAGWALGTWLVVSLIAVLALRFVAPPATMVMLLEPGPVREIEFRFVDRAQIPVAVARAVIAAEDQKFVDHFGFDFEELGDAISEYRAGDELRGASTISQQVAKNVFLWNGRSIVRKALEAYMTVLIEAVWSKERILEVYLNVAEFGTGVFGVEAAAQRLLGKQTGTLTEPDAALLAAVLPSPKRLHAHAPSAYVRSRQAEILGQMRLLAARGHYAGLDWPQAD